MFLGHYVQISNKLLSYYILQHNAYKYFSTKIESEVDCFHCPTLQNMLCPQAQLPVRHLPLEVPLSSSNLLDPNTVSQLLGREGSDGVLAPSLSWMLGSGEKAEVTLAASLETKWWETREKKGGNLTTPPCTRSLLSILFSLLQTRSKTQLFSGDTRDSFTVKL